MTREDDDSGGRVDGTADEPEATPAGADGSPVDAEDEREWRFSVVEVGPDGVTEDPSTPRDEPIEPGDVNLEHAALVVLGVAITVGTLVFGF